MEVFSISALDLFASSLGVFMIITFVLFPYFRNKDEAEKTLAVATERAQQATERERTAQAAAEEAARRARQAEDPKDQRLLAEAQQKLQAAQARMAVVQGQLDKLRLDAEAIVDFTILGLPTKAKSFVVVADMSGSMTAYAHILVSTLDRILHPLDHSAQMSIIGFQGAPPATLHFWPARGNVSAMNVAGKTAAMAFGKDMQTRFRGPTPTLAALQTALEYNVEAVVLLSDGAPTDAPASYIVDTITSANAGKKEIHTVAIGDYNKAPGLVNFLQNLARRNKGAFTGVAK